MDEENKEPRPFDPQAFLAQRQTNVAKSLADGKKSNNIMRTVSAIVTPGLRYDDYDLPAGVPTKRVLYRKLRMWWIIGGVVISILLYAVQAIIELGNPPEKEVDKAEIVKTLQDGDTQ